MTTEPTKQLETFANPHPHRDYEIEFDCPEFTCLCPLTGQPDFARFHITYVPAEKCVELKSLKLYLWSYRNEGAFHEDVTNRILDDLVEATQPRLLEITGEWFVRGGIKTQVSVSYVDEDWDVPYP
jgi:7-cyano-7-deazaguanine reductase